MKISLNTHLSLTYQLCACATELCRGFEFSKRLAALLGEHSFGNALCFVSRAVHICTFQKLCPSLHCSANFSLVLIPTGHGIWTGKFWEHPPFDVPDWNGNFVAPVLAGFYMFLTMIILLQVKDKNLSVTSKEEATEN